MTCARKLLPILCLLMAATVQANDLGDALEMHAAGKPAEAAQLLQPLAESGDMLAQYNLGVILEDVDPALAARWYARAAQAGQAQAAFNLGHLYLAGRGAPRDLPAAREAFQRGAELGLPAARYNYAQLLEQGVGGDANSTEAERQYSLAVEAGEVHAQLRQAQKQIEHDELAAWRQLRQIASRRDLPQSAQRALEDVSQVFAGRAFRVRPKVVNLRAEPNRSASIRVQLRSGDELLRLEQRGDWLQVALREPREGVERGWIFASLLRPIK
jgi:TPR repeat protein